MEQLFNSSEKRLARVLLLLAQFGKEDEPEKRNPQNQPGSSGGNGGHIPGAREFLHEPLPEAGASLRTTAQLKSIHRC